MKFSCLVFLFLAALAPAFADTTVEVFAKAGIEFQTDAAKQNWQISDGVKVADNGRRISRTVTMPSYDPRSRIWAVATLGRVPATGAPNDPWDRAGNVWLETASGKKIDLLKFATPFGGETKWKVEVTDLAPLLQGDVTVTAYIDTWKAEARTIDFSFVIDEEASVDPAAWVEPLVTADRTWNASDFADDRRVTVNVTVPEKTNKVVLTYYASGHGDGADDCDEFKKKMNTIRIDGEIVYRKEPWRTDGPQFRKVNITSGNEGGTTSSDFARSNWIPGDIVKPEKIEVTGKLAPGPHVIDFRIDGINAKAEKGFWRVSAYLSGWSE